MNAIPPENTTDLNNVKIGMKTPIVASTDANGISGEYFLKVSLKCRLTRS